MNQLQLFQYTINEYKKFYNYFSLHKSETMLDPYDDSDYIAISTKLMILRKYMTPNNKVYLPTILSQLKKRFPADMSVDNLIQKFDAFESSNINTTRKNGNSYTMRETVEQFLYGLLLHSDGEKIDYLRDIDEGLVFIVVREYVEGLEDIVLEISTFIDNKNITPHKKTSRRKASAIIMDTNEISSRNIKKSPYWDNLQGKDLNDHELLNTISCMNDDEFAAYICCNLFFAELKKDDFNRDILDTLVHPKAKRGFDNYCKAREIYLSWNKPGFSTDVRFNERHDIAYVKIFTNVESAFEIEGRHIVTGIIYANLVLDDNHWKMYSVGEKMNDYYLREKQTSKNLKHLIHKLSNKSHTDD